MAWDKMGRDGEGNGSTYFFRIMPRREYRKAEDIEVFRREPIYLSEEKMNEPEYFRYKMALEKLPALRTLRAFFIGRVAHHSAKRWQADVEETDKEENGEGKANK